MKPLGSEVSDWLKPGIVIGGLVTVSVTGSALKSIKLRCPLYPQQHRSHSAWHKTRRPSGRGADEILSRDQSKNGQSARPHRTADVACTRGRRDRIARPILLHHAGSL